MIFSRSSFMLFSELAVWLYQKVRREILTGRREQFCITQNDFYIGNHVNWVLFTDVVSKRFSICTNKDHNHEVGEQISLPPRFLALKVQYQHNRNKKFLHPSVLKQKSRDVTLKPIKKWLLVFFHLWKSFTDKYWEPKYCYGQLNSHRIYVSNFSSFYRVWFLPVNMDILNIFLCVNKKLQKTFTIGNSEQVFLKGSDQCKNKMDKLQK